MEELLYYTVLYDTYGNLLTAKQRCYFEDYYFHNLSFQEMADNYQVSRPAIHKQVKEVVQKMQYYENNLHLVEKHQLLEEVIATCDVSMAKKLQAIIDL